MFINLDDDKGDSINIRAGEYLEVELIRDSSIIKVTISSPLTNEVYEEYISNRETELFYNENNLWRVVIDTSWMEYSNYDLNISALEAPGEELIKFTTISVKR